MKKSSREDILDITVKNKKKKKKIRMFYDETYVSDTRIYCKKENNEEIDSDDEEMLEQREDERKVKAEIMALLEKRLKA